MNRQGVTPIMTFVIAGTALLLWAFVFGNQLSYWGGVAAAQTSGIEAFLLTYANLFFFFIPLVIFVIVSLRFGGNQ
jgi:hypothetical protein